MDNTRILITAVFNFIILIGRGRGSRILAAGDVDVAGVKFFL